MCAGRGRGCRHAYHGPPQCCQRYSMIAVVDQSPMRSAVITKPIVLDTPLLLPGTNKRRHGRFSWFGHAVGLDQKQLAFAKSKEGLTALRIGTSAEHVFTASRSAKNNPGEQLDSESRARRRPLPFPSALQGFRTARLAGMDIFLRTLPPNRQYVPTPRRSFLACALSAQLPSIVCRRSCSVRRIISMSSIRKTRTWPALSLPKDRENPQWTE